MKSRWIRVGFVAGAVLAVGVLVALASRPRANPPPAAPDPPSPQPPSQEPEAANTTPARTLAPPSDVPARLKCTDARRVIAQARDNLVQVPAPVDPRKLAEATADWLDPHGLWSAAPDAPVGAALQQEAKLLLAALERGDPQSCAAADRIGVLLAKWVEELRRVHDDAQKQPRGADIDVGWRAATDPLFENGQVSRSAHKLAREQGLRASSLLATYGEPMRRYVDQARARLFPEIPPQVWGEILLAAAVRAYVLQIDPHGAWAPLDEESSLYEVELEASGRTRLWQKMTRTAAGVRVEQGALSPLADGDVVLAIGGIPIAGLSVEQAEQLGILDPNDGAPERDVLVLRAGEQQSRLLRAEPPAPSNSVETAGSVEASSVAFGGGQALVVRVADIPDDLGDELAVLIAEHRSRSTPVGILIDLRGNGGGSTDGARAAIGLFLPGARLFPLRRRDGALEVERAARPAETDLWTGPVATLVDGTTASAAEMFAGALASYHRGVLLGAPTYGKGCAQEYVNDEAGVGILRLTTLVYALPDGSAVQRTGLRPNLFISGLSESGEHESSYERAPAAWTGPDVRDAASIREVPWSTHGGKVGPCRDEAICRALRVLGSARGATARWAK